MERKTVNFEKDDCLHTKINACIVLQKTVRGYLTRLKLAEAKEIYDSIFFETENGGDGFQLSWEHNDTVCWPIATLTLKPNQEPNYTNLESGDSTGTAGQCMNDSMGGINALLEDLSELVGFCSSSSHAPKPCASQPAIRKAGRHVTTSSTSAPSLGYYGLTKQYECNQRSVSPYNCKLCRKIKSAPENSGDPTMVVQSLRSKSRCPRVWRPSGVPATTVDGTMFRKTGCYLGQQETESFSDRARLYSTKVQKRARVRAARTPTTRHHGYSIPNVPRDWPRARIQRCSHGREVRKAVSPTTESQFPSTTATTLAQLPGETSRSTLTESCVQTSGLAGPVVVDASVQTVSEAAVQTDPPPMTSHPVELLEGMQGSSSGSISSAGTGSTLSAGTGSTTSAGTGSTTSAGTDILPSESGENVAEDSLLRNSSQPQRPASVASTSTDDILEFTAVTPLPTHNKSESSLPAANQSEASESFQAGHKHSSTPLSTPSNKHNQQLTSDSKVRQLPTEETSLWTQATLPPSNINSDATESELRAMKENMSMELMWIEQAIASRKQYLSLKKSMADDKQPTES